MTTTCETFIERIGEPGSAGDAELQAHLSACAGCRAVAEAVGQLQSTRSEPDAKVLTGFAFRVKAARAQREERQRRSIPMRSGLVAGALAAAGAVAVGVFLDFASPHHSQLADESPAMEATATAGNDVQQASEVGEAADQGDEVFSAEAFADAALPDSASDLDLLLDDDLGEI